MLDLQRYSNIRLTALPRAQVAVMSLGLAPNYAFFPGVQIVFEGQEKVPSGPVIYAMNHTDRYNYFPFQYTLARRAGRYTATWVKGKYYERLPIAVFMERTNQLPTVSKGYLITKDFARTVGRAPTESEYELLRALVTAAAAGETCDTVPPGSIPLEVTTAPRDMLGRRFEPDREGYADCVNHLFEQMMRRFVQLNEEAHALGLDILIFPQGTRSVRLLPSHIGIAQLALHLRAPIVPVGCNGSDKVYPGNLPVARKGRVVYRFGEAIQHEDIPELQIAGSFEPFSQKAESLHRDKFEALAAMVTGRIDALLDPEYKLAGDRSSGGTRGINRFV